MTSQAVMPIGCRGGEQETVAGCAAGARALEQEGQCAVCWPRRSMTCARASCGGRVGVPPPARTQPPPPRPWYHLLKAIALLRGAHQAVWACSVATQRRQIAYARISTSETQSSNKEMLIRLPPSLGVTPTHTKQWSMSDKCYYTRWVIWQLWKAQPAACRRMERGSLVRAGWQEVVLGPRVAARVPLLRPRPPHELSDRRSELNCGARMLRGLRADLMTCAPPRASHSACNLLKSCRRRRCGAARKPAAARRASSAPWRTGWPWPGTPCRRQRSRSAACGRSSAGAPRPAPAHVSGLPLKPDTTGQESAPGAQVLHAQLICPALIAVRPTLTSRASFQAPHVVAITVRIGSNQVFGYKCRPIPKIKHTATVSASPVTAQQSLHARLSRPGCVP